MVEKLSPKPSSHLKMKVPSWMNEFTETLSVPGKGGFAGYYKGISSSRGRLQVYHKKPYWLVQFQPEGLMAPYERRLTSKFQIVGYEKSRSFYKNFVQHGNVHITFGNSAMLQFHFDDLKRDEEMLKKISSVFEYFFKKNENCQMDLSLSNDQSESPMSDKTDSNPQEEKPTSIFQKKTISARLSTLPSPKTVSTPVVEPMEIDGNEKYENKFIPTSNSCTLYSNDYISDLLLETKPTESLNIIIKEIENDKSEKNKLIGKVNGILSPVKINGVLSPTKLNGILSPSKCNIQTSSSKKDLEPVRKLSLTSNECRRQKKNRSFSANDDGNLLTDGLLFYDNQNVFGESINDLNKKITDSPRMSTNSFYGSNRNSFKNRCFTTVDSLSNGSKPFTKNYSRRSLTSKRDYDSECTGYLNGSAKKLRLGNKIRDEKENGCDDKQGFTNIRNSCYMNATLQALLSFPFFITSLSIEKYSQIDGLLMSFLALSEIRFEICGSKKNNILNEFKEKMIKASNKFDENGRHEDAHEYYLSFKESLQQEIHQVFPNDRVLEDTLNLEMVETRMCPTCSKHSKNGTINEQTHSELGIDIPDEMAYADNYRLENLIELTLKSSTVPFNCECGETHVDIFKRFSRLPKILVVHLHRYCLKDGVIEKNKSDITISNTLDLKSFCTDHVITPRAEKKINCFINNSENESNKYKYQLQAVIEHIGSWASGGHYIARIRHKDQWLRCDDLKITEMDEDLTESSQKNAYLLFYAHSSYLNELG